jgi:protein-L-isoaspartate(D-aspartate) O-methyltransferase
LRRGALSAGPQDLVEASRAAGVRDPRVLDAVGGVPRRDFVPREHADLAYLDVPVPIAHEQVTTQPSLVARMVEALALRGGGNVLEVGSGLGWQTALLARLAAAVWSVERWPDLAAAAAANLAAHGIANARVVAGDGSQGWADHAPYDAIVVSAAFPSVPPPLAAQLVPAGRLVQPIGPGGHEDVVLFVKEGDRLARKRSVSAAYFVRLYGRHGYPAATVW